jgi:hypothetical protein
MVPIQKAAPAPINALTNRRTLNRIVNTEIKRYTALFSLLFPASTHDNLDEEFAQIDVTKGKLGMAPFVVVGGEPRYVDVLNGTEYVVETPYISMKRPLTYSTRLAARQAGGNVFVGRGAGEIGAAIQKAITKDANTMNTLADNREEWMAAHILRGQVTYAEDGLASFTINTGKPAVNTYTVTNLWDGGSATPFEDIGDAKRIIANNRGPQPDVAICGATAAAALRALAEAGSITAIKTTSGVDSGRADIRQQIQDSGMIFLGRYAEVDFFEYLGKYLPDPNAADYVDATTEVNYIRDDYVEYFSTSQLSLSMRTMFYGLIPSLKAIMAGEANVSRYMVSIPPTEEIDTYRGILKSRPLPWLFRADWQVSQKVT